MLLSVKRWLDMMCLLAIAFTICVIFSSYIESCSMKLYLITLLYPDWVRVLINSLLAMIIWQILFQLGGYRVRFPYLNSFFKYPPTWFFGVLGGGLYLYFLSIFKYENFIALQGIGLSICSFLLGIAVVSIYNLKTPNKLVSSDLECNGLDSFDELISNPVNLIYWIEIEKPIESPNEDLFGFSIISERVAGLLRSEKIQTIGIVGPYGCGKSSLINLIKTSLAQPFKSQNHRVEKLFEGNVLTCQVDGWGRSKDSIARQILAIAVRRLSLEVDCLSIITLPSGYQKALSGSKNVIAAMASALLGSEKDPVDILKRLDTILQTINTRIVIILEDLDRNVSKDSIDKEMPSLLDRLKCLEQVSFILAIGTGQEYSDVLVRICEHLETLS